MPFNYEKAREVHGDKYDYSLVDFKNVDTKVTIICPIHGEFNQTPYHHCNREQGCRQCRGRKISESKRLSLKEFTSRARKIHRNFYDYSLCKYKNAHTKIEIICPHHGSFFQTPNNHLYSQNGCPSCGYNTSKTANKWLDELGIHKKNREKTIYINNQRYKVDALVGDTIYEYFGYFWHGHPARFDPNDINPKNKRSFGELYQETLDRIKTLEDNGYSLVCKWGD